ncbi:FkbM family methyltransferase [Cyclobacterium plantarum]|uniref:FkbM family methyltransferase n=1 Tax=Cyclobacterium plantarum TaxID=2716263 RepID=UPI001C9E4FA2|nr:FkbM family methyltransferase [Cyclobacterium plantarum]
MRNKIEKFLSGISRQLFRIPGGYYIVKFLKNLFPVPKTPNWRIFRFRGIVFKVDLSKGMGNAIYWRGAHDWGPLFVLESILKKGATFIDIGANQGEYTLWGLRKVGLEGMVVAYEPSNAIFQQLEENIRLNPQYTQAVKTRKLGLSNKPGKLKLYTKSGSNEGVNSIFPSEEHDVFLNEINLSTLDKEVETLGWKRIDCLKIDVEGAELNVLLGAEKTIHKFRPIIITEISKSSCEAAGYDPKKILQFLENHHYKLNIIGLRGKIRPINKDTIPDFFNLIAFPI